ncbi:MAG: EamA family transporter [Gemmatimonadetes bacterium]|nr:EamA family transporter [Gemmatimonadota bacterium]
MAVVPLSVRERVALLAAFGAVWFIWGSTYLAIAWAVESIPPLLMIGARCVIAGGLLYGWARWRGGPRPAAADWRGAAVAGVLLFVTGQAVLAWSETRIASGAASLLIATEPMFIALIGWRGGRLAGGAGEPGRFPGASLAAILVGFAGVAVLVLPGGEGGLDLLGAVAAVLASLSWSVGVFRSGPRPGIRPGQLAGMQLLVAGGVLLALSGLLGDFARLPAGGPSPRAIAAFFHLVVMGSVVAYGAYVWLLGRVGPTRLSTHAYVNPLVAVVLGIALNGEPISAALVLATLLILGSVAMLLSAGRLPASAAPRPSRRPRSPAATDSSATARPRRTPSGTPAARSPGSAGWGSPGRSTGRRAAS